MEVDLGPGHNVLDGDAALPMERGTSAPLTFRPMSTVVKWLDGSEIPLGMETGLGPGDIVRWGPSSPPTERGTAAPHFSAMSIVAKRHLSQPSYAASAEVHSKED